MFLLFQIILVFLTLFCFGKNACASAPTIPITILEQIDPGRSAEDLSNPEDIYPLPEQTIIKLPETATSISKATKDIKFTIKKIVIQGSTIFDQKELENTYKHLLNTEVSLDQVMRVASNITSQYHAQGYILSKVILPPQEITDGKVVLQAIEGYISDTCIIGRASNPTQRLLQQYGLRLSKSKPLKMADLERYALLANDIPGVTVKISLYPAKISGAAEVCFAVKEKLEGWYLGVNNYNTEILGSTQFTGGAYVNSFFSGSQTGVRGVISPGALLKYSQFQHRQMIDDNGFVFEINISQTETKPNYNNVGLNDFSTPGEAFLSSLTFSYPSIRSRQQNLIIEARFNYLNTKTTFAGVNLFNDHIRNLCLQIDYDFLDNYSGSNITSFDIVQGLKVLHAFSSPPSIQGGKLDFTKVNLNLSRNQGIIKQYLYLVLSIKSQYSFNQLLSAEKFGFGGGPFGYGYSPSVIVGDSGVAARTELQYNQFIKNRYFPHMQLFACADTATVWNINKALLPARQSATSAGGGVRAVTLKSLCMELVLAVPFNRYTTNDNKHSLQFLFNILYSY